MKKVFIVLVSLVLLISCSKEKASDKEVKKEVHTNNSTSPKKSPKFVSYENFDGSKTSLDDLKGKYVYVDVWATWCPPCRAEIPYLKKIEEKYHNKNIAFVSISVDRAKDKAKWKKMIEDKKMGGIQLFANNDQTFTSGYRINGIPRFILIDPKGNIANANAPRPSDSKGIDNLFSKI